MKSRNIKNAKRFEDIPNVGSSIAHDLKTLGFIRPLDLKGKNPLTLYKNLCKKTKSRQDPCLLDVFISVVEFANGKDPRPWWKYTKKRKRKYPNI